MLLQSAKHSLWTSGLTCSQIPTQLPEQELIQDSSELRVVDVERLVELLMVELEQVVELFMVQFEQPGELHMVEFKLVELDESVSL